MAISERTANPPGFKNLVGMTFGELKVTSHSERRHRIHYWGCLCSCGKETVVQGKHLRTGHTTSCGHVHRLRFSRKTHGQSHTTEYRIWSGILTRCYNQRSRPYRNYGGRGITVCDSWRASFGSFLADVGERPSRAHSIDRINNDGPYSPENCRWATKVEQCNNTRYNRRLTFRGETKTLTEWCRLLGLGASMVVARMDRYGWSVDRALATPSRDARTTS
jgi:hypothetical protein